MAEVSDLVVPTRDRPDQCIAAVESYFLHLREHSRSVRLVVCDQSENIDSSHRLRLRAESLCHRFGHELAYLDSVSVSSTVGTLKRLCDIDPELLEFLFRPHCQLNYGANRNLGLLMCASRNALFFDDDTFCIPMAAPNTDIEFVSPVEPWIVEAFSSEEEMSSTLYPVAKCVLDDHEDLLGTGHSVYDASVVSEIVDSCSPLNDARPSLPRVTIVSNGIYGDSGMRFFPSQLASPYRRVRDQFYDDQRNLELKFSGRYSIRSSRRCSVRRSSSFMSTVFSVDNTKPLFPFFPFGRGEDHTFGLLNALSGSLIVDSPLCLRHARDTPHQLDYDFCQPTLSGVLSGFFSRLSHLRTKGCDADPMDPMSTLSRSMLEIASLGSCEILDLVLQTFRSDQREKIDSLLLSIDSYQDGYHISRRLLDRQTLICERNMKLTSDEIASIVVPERAPDLAESIRNYSKAVLAWSELHRCATEMSV